MVVMRVEAKPLQMTYAQAHSAHAAGCYTGTMARRRKDVHVDASMQLCACRNLLWPSRIDVD